MGCAASSSVPVYTRRQSAPLPHVHADPALEAPSQTDGGERLSARQKELFDALEREMSRLGESDADDASEPGACCFTFQRRRRVAGARMLYGITSDAEQFCASAELDAVIVSSREQVNAWLDDNPQMIMTVRKVPTRFDTGSEHAPLTDDEHRTHPCIPGGGIDDGFARVLSGTLRSVHHLDSESPFLSQSPAGIRSPTSLSEVDPQRRSVHIASTYLALSASSDDDGGPFADEAKEVGPVTIQCRLGKVRATVPILCPNANRLSFPLHEAVVVAHNRIIQNALDDAARECVRVEPTRMSQ